MRNLIKFTLVLLSIFSLFHGILNAQETKPAETAEDLALSIEGLRKKVNNISSIKEFGISKEDWDKNLDYIAGNALIDPCTGFNPRVPSLEDLKNIYNACYLGFAYSENEVLS